MDVVCYQNLSFEIFLGVGEALPSMVLVWVILLSFLRLEHELHSLLLSSLLIQSKQIRASRKHTNLDRDDDDGIEDQLQNHWTIK